MKTKIKFKRKKVIYEDDLKEYIGKAKILRKAFKFLISKNKTSFCCEDTLAVNKL